MILQALISTVTNKMPASIEVNTVYSGKQTKRGLTVKAGKKTLSPKQSLKICKHSPGGFGWGYMGSGPAQLALALLLDATGDQSTAFNFYQKFKAVVVAKWGDTWSISKSDIRLWLELEKGYREQMEVG